MIEVKEVLYQWMQGSSIKKLSRSLAISRNTVREIIQQAQGLGLEQKSTLAAMEVLALQLHTARYKKPRPPTRVQSLLQAQHAQLEAWQAMPYMTITQMVRLLSAQGCVVSVSSLRTYLHKNGKPVLAKTTLHILTQPGQQAQVDFGYVGIMADAEGKLRKTHAFIMTLSHSRHRFVCFVFKQDSLTWLECHIKAFTFFGGVPHTVLLDNLKSGVDTPDIYDPIVHRAYGDLEKYYGFVIDPAKVRMPQHKGKVERSVTLVKQQLIAGCHYKDIEAANQAAWKWCKEVLAHTVTRTTGETPWALFIREEQAQLRPLPRLPFECPVWQPGLVHRDQHIVFAGSFYSVPQVYVGQQTWVRATQKIVQIFKEEQLIKTHPRTLNRGKWITDALDYPDTARAFLEKDMTYCVAKAKALGGAIEIYLCTVLEAPSLTRQRKAQAVLRLGDVYGMDRLEAACHRALVFNNPAFKSLQRILMEGLDRLPLEDAPLPVPASRRGVFLRKPEEFGAVRRISACTQTI